MVSHIEVNDAGKCKSVYYIDRLTRAHREVEAKAVVLCASTLESTRIMLNSRSAKYPNGIANGSGVLGHYLMDHVMGGGARGVLPMIDKSSASPSNARRPNGIYVPRFRNLTDKHPDFIRGYGYQGGATVEKWGHASTHPRLRGDVQAARARRADLVLPLRGLRASACPASRTSSTSTRTRVDAWGIPVLHISMAWSDNEKTMVKDMSEEAAAMLEAAGAENVEEVWPNPPSRAWGSTRWARPAWATIPRPRC